MVSGGKKGCPRERNLREIYNEKNYVLSFVSFVVVVFAST
jgi:hypothetical protein